jgi:stage V sporulation protein B
MKDEGSKLVKGTVIIIIFTLVSALLGYILKIFLAKSLSIYEIGLFYSVFGFISFFIFIRDLGLCNSFVYFIPTYIVKKLNSEIKKIIIFSLLVQFIIGILLAFLFMLSSNFLSIYYFKDEQAILLIIWLSVYFVLESVIEVLHRVFHSYQNMFLTKLIEFSIQFISTILIICGIILGFPISYFGIYYVITVIITSGIFFFIFYYKLFINFFSVKYNLLKSDISKFINYSIPTMFGDLAEEIFSKQSIFFITLFLGLDSVGYYVMALSLASISSFLNKAMVQVFAPKISELFIKKHTTTLSFYLNEIITFSYIFAIPVSLIFIVFSKEILVLFYGNNYAIASSLFILHSIYFLFINLKGILKRVFMSVGIPRLARNVSIVTVVSNLILNFILIPKYGLIGAGIADLISGILSVIVSIYLHVKLVKIRLPCNSFINIFIASIPLYFSMSILKKYLSFPLLPNLIIIIGFSLIIYLIFLVVLKIINYKKIINLYRLIK